MKSAKLDEYQRRLNRRGWRWPLTLRGTLLALGILFLLAAAFLASGCGGSFNELPDQPEAEAIIWYQTYGETQPPPPVEWFADPVVPASFGDSGRTLLGWKVQIAQAYDPIYYTSYAHELFHWHCFNATHDVDAAHSHCDWGLVDKANHDTLDALDPSPSERRERLLVEAARFHFDADETKQ